MCTGSGSKIIRVYLNQQSKVYTENAPAMPDMISIKTAHYS